MSLSGNAGNGINLPTIIVAVILIAITVTIIAVWIKNKRAGKSGCGGNCAGCAMSEMCENQDKNQ